MQRQTVASTHTPHIVIYDLPGDLRLVGWERDEITVRTPGESLEVLREKNDFRIRCDDDLISSIPTQADLDIESIAGDADLRNLTGNCRIQQAGGDLTGRSLAHFQSHSVSGNLSLRGVSGSISATNIGGDVSLRAAQADVTLTSIGGDLYLRGASGDVSAAVGGDAMLCIEPRPGATVTVTAAGDILLRLPPNADARIEAQGGGSESVHINLPGIPFEPETWSGEITLGSGSAAIRLNAGGNITITGQADESAADFDFEAGFSGMPADLSGRIQRQVERATRQAERADAAMRHAEQKMREAERRIQARVNARVGRWGMDWSGSMPRPPRPPQPPVPPSNPVTDEEQLMILRMLAEKKITAEEAEKLLSALE